MTEMRVRTIRYALIWLLLVGATASVSWAAIARAGAQASLLGAPPPLAATSSTGAPAVIRPTQSGNGAAADAVRHGAAADAAVNGAPDIRATHLDVRARHAAIDLQLARGQLAAPRSVGSQALQHGGWSAVGLLRGRHTQSARRPRGRVGVPRLDGRCQAGSHLRAARRAWRPH